LVYLAIEGGFGTLVNINEILEKKSAPVILIKGSAGYCDLIIDAKNEDNINKM
jgi:hypothetical protein